MEKKPLSETNLQNNIYHNLPKFSQERARELFLIEFNKDKQKRRKKRGLYKSQNIIQSNVLYKQSLRDHFYK